MSNNKSSTQKLAELLDESKMQVTFTGWKAELEDTEKRLRDAETEVERLNAEAKSRISANQKIRQKFILEIEKLQLENKVLKEKLSVAESQVEDLKSQIAYWENGGGVS